MIRARFDLGGILISVTETVIAGALGMSVCVPIRYWEAPLYVKSFPPMYTNGWELIEGVSGYWAAWACNTKVKCIPASM